MKHLDGSPQYSFSTKIISERGQLAQFSSDIIEGLATKLMKLTLEAVDMNTVHSRLGCLFKLE